MIKTNILLAEQIFKATYGFNGSTLTDGYLFQLVSKYYEQCGPRKINNILNKLKSSGKRDLFIIRFIKRGNNRLRVMRGRFNITEYLKGGTLPYNPKEKNVIICFDVRKKEYRCINLERLISLDIHGKRYVVK